VGALDKPGCNEEGVQDVHEDEGDVVDAQEEAYDAVINVEGDLDVLVGGKVGKDEELLLGIG